MSTRSIDQGKEYGNEIKVSSPVASSRVRNLRNYDRHRTISSSSDTIRKRTSSLGRRASLSFVHHDSVTSYKEDDDHVAKIVEETQHSVPWWTSKRVCLSLICFFGFFFLYAQRVNLSVAIVCMVQSEVSKQRIYINTNKSEVFLNSTFSLDEIKITNQSNVIDMYNIVNMTVTKSSIEKHICPISLTEKENKEKEFVWSKNIQGLILGSFFWGYTLMQIPGGLLAERFGPRLVVALGMFMVSMFTLLTPVLARGSPYLLIIGRVLIGLGEATMYPSAQVLWAKWSPPHERSRLVGFAFGGCQLGNALAFPIAGFLCQYGFDGGWPSIFYLLGVASSAWCILWAVCVRDSPRQMTSISAEERNYIELSLGVHESDHTTIKHRKESKPWKSIMKSLPVWSILVANACGNYGAYMLLTQMPTYMKEVLKFDIKSNGVYSMIPYIGYWLMVIVAGTCADYIISREYIRIEWARKLCCGLGHFIPAAFLIAVGYMDCQHQIEAVVLLTLSMSFCGFQMASVFINHGDIAPRYAGTIFGITNTGASVPGIIAPYVVAAITQNKTQAEWQVTFYIAAIVYCLGAIFYMVFGKGDIQPWAEQPEEKEGANSELRIVKEENIKDTSAFESIDGTDEVFNVISDT